ncbi:hypothetical protein QYE76_038392 [Lolium multiflorum]|uniref:Uncharacterized protein n=1 Tax=Lolium multiflorum TaxID=4521 RepID=A0AAD8T7S3_LOLMU|nr:hypothetical protein QYE76_038392 [Lolium multiflorum]
MGLAVAASLEATAAQAPQLQEELQLSREQCFASQETAKALAAKVKEMKGELARLRPLEANHLTELNNVKQHARITPITMLGHELRLAAEELFRLLWPMETLPVELANLVKWLDTAPDRLLG